VAWGLAPRKEARLRATRGTVPLNCEHSNREKKTRERFVLVCATEGPLAGVPVFIEYQPKWWFKAQGVLDDSEVFP